jgi:hypothetical protein
MGRRPKPAWCFRHSDCSLYGRCLNMLARKDPDNLPCYRCGLYNPKEYRVTWGDLLGSALLLREIFFHPKRP